MQYVSQFFSILNDVFLKMTWLSDLIAWIVNNIFRLPINDTDIWGKIGGSLQFFIYDSIKIIALLSVLIFIFSYIESKFTPEKTKRLLSKLKGIKGATLGALLGTVTPFCSCSSIPIFISFVKAGLPMEVTFSFLISSPFVDLASTVLLASMFGWKVAIVYVVVGVLLAIIGGMLIGKLKLEKYIQDYVFDMKVGETQEVEPTKKERIQYAKEQVKNIFVKVWKYVLLGVGIGAFIHNWIPQTMVETILGNGNIFAPILAAIVGIQYAKEQVKNIFVKVWKYVLLGVGIGAFIHNWIPQTMVETILGNGNIFAPILAAIVGIPMYADIFGTMPIAEALVLKGTGIGTVLTFMMGVTALSIPSIVMLKQVMKNKLLGIFVGIISVGIILIGYVFNIFGFLII